MRKALVNMTSEILLANQRTLLSLTLVGISNMAKEGSIVLQALYRSKITALNTLDLTNNEKWWSDAE